MNGKAAFRLEKLSLLVLLAVVWLLPLRALGAATAVREPAWGLPHIYADTDLEMARENGRQIAKDRLGQLVLLARVGRGTLGQAFGLLDPGTVLDDIETRRTQYTSSELNDMYNKLPQRFRDLILEYCKGVNDSIEQVYAGSEPEPIEVNILAALGLGADLFGNATNLSDQVDPFYLAPGGADPQRPNGGFQFTPEMAVSIAILEIRNFGFENFNEPSRLNELQALQTTQGNSLGEEMWLDLNFLNDPLAPVSVPDATTPGYGGPLAASSKKPETLLAQAAAGKASSEATVTVASSAGQLKSQGAKSEEPATEIARKAGPAEKPETKSELTKLAKRWPAYEYAEAEREREERLAMRAERAKRLGAWPALGSYAWVIAANKSATGNPWLGGFPQTGIQTPSIMHFAENRTAEDVQTIGMEFAGGPAVLIGQTDTVAWTSTTAQLRVVDTFFEKILNEEVDNVRYDAEGTPAELSQRTETILSPLGNLTRVFWRSHETNGNGGSRPIVDFLGDAEGQAESATATTLVDNDAAFAGSLVGGHVLLIDGTGAGQIREITAAGGTSLTIDPAWTTPPDNTSVYVATNSADDIIAVAQDSTAFFEETTAFIGFARMQESQSILDVRSASRVIPTTHNFPSIDNQPFNTIGTDGGSGNIAYYSSGFSRKRQGAGDEEKLLPLDGTAANPLVVVSGTVDSATNNTLTSTGTFISQTLSPEPINFRYDNPTQQGSDYIVTITSGTGARQSRRISSNTDDELTVEYEWGVNPAPGDTFDVYEIVAMPEAVNPAEGYSANWNNKGATADDGRGFGRNHRVAFILERLAAENAWDRQKQRQLNKDLAGISGSGNRGRYLVPRLRHAFDSACSGDATVEAVLLALEAHNDQTNCLNLATTDDCGRDFVDPVFDTTRAGEESFLSTLISQLANDIYGDEFAGAVSVPGGATGLALVLHAIDSAAGDVPGSYTQQYSGNYFGASWESVLCGAMAAIAGGGIPPDSPRGNSTYNHPLAGLFSELSFEPTPSGNRGTWEQIVEAGTVVNGEFMFPLGQSGLIEGSLGGVTGIDPNFDSIQPIWRDWRFLPMLHVGQDLAGGGNPDSDGDGVWDAFERWYFGDLSRKGTDDGDGDKLRLVDEFSRGADPTDADTDDDGIPDGQDPAVQNRFESGVTKLKAFVKYGNDPGTDFLNIVATIGTGSPEFDPNTKGITLTVTDDDTIYAVTIPAGTMEEKLAGRKWLYKDKDGTLGGLTKALVKLGKEAGKPAKLKFKTIKMDLSNADQTDHVVDVEIVFGAHTIPDSRLWTFDGKKLKATK